MPCEQFPAKKVPNSTNTDWLEASVASTGMWLHFMSREKVETPAGRRRALVKRRDFIGHMQNCIGIHADTYNEITKMIREAGLIGHNYVQARHEARVELTQHQDLSADDQVRADLFTHIMELDRHIIRTHDLIKKLKEIRGRYFSISKQVMVVAAMMRAKATRVKCGPLPGGKGGIKVLMEKTMRNNAPYIMCLDTPGLGGHVVGFYIESHILSKNNYCFFDWNYNEVITSRLSLTAMCASIAIDGSGHNGYELYELVWQ